MDAPQLKISFSQQPLVLPRRYELLEAALTDSGGEVTQVVKKIETACSQIEKLLAKVRVGRSGQFQLFLGESGSGKTTFLRTLPHFFDNVEVTTFDENVPLINVVDRIGASSHVDKERVFVVDGRDNPIVIKEELNTFFERLRIAFRKNGGNVLIIWPITNRESAEEISRIAWEIGKESIAPSEGPVFSFQGLPKADFYEVADITIRSLNSGETLENFGISKSVADSLLSESSTIGEYYSRIEDLTITINEKTKNVLRKKVHPKVWILLAGDSSRDLDMTVKSLTSGVENKIDIDRMCAYLDDPSNESAYLNDWRSRRTQAGYLLRFLDVRIFALYPNCPLSAVRMFGESKTKENLRKKSPDGKKQTFDLMRKTSFYRALVGTNTSSVQSARATETDTRNEYLRLQQLSIHNDNILNSSIAQLISQVLVADDVQHVAVITEKQQLRGTNLRPDIQINVNENESICIELTWRSTGAEIENEVSKKQNTLTAGHIQKYVLEKVMEYVKELGLDGN